MIVALDWDDTLVDVKTQEWLPGAREALEGLLSNESVTVIVHSCRANWPEGLASIHARLAPLGDIAVVGKPLADVYVDDKAVRFTGWPRTLDSIPVDQAAPYRPRERAIDPSAAAILAGWHA